VKLIGLVFGTAFGFVLSAALLTDYNVIHRMLLFKDWQPFLIMGSAVAIAVPGLRLLKRVGWVTPLGGPLTFSPSTVQRHHVVGSLLFGTGWAIAGTCPGPAAAMLGSGRVMGIFIVAGIFSGILLRDAMVARATARPAAVSPEPLGVGL